MLGRLFSDLIRSAAKGRLSLGDASPRDANPLEDYFRNNTGRQIVKWQHYFEIYHRHFATFRGRSPVVVEIGVLKGGSLQMWHHYFGPGTRVVGVDIDPGCLEFEDGDTTILIGDQADREFLATFRERVPRVDILIDDGGHTMTQQITTFEELYPHVQPEGVYLCEDMQTSLWSEFGGGYGKPGTFLDYSKSLIDRLYGWHSRDPAALAVDAFTRSAHSLHFYDGVLVIEKRPMERPRQYMTGETPDRGGA